MSIEWILKNKEHLKKYYKETGIFIPIHIDAAIGGFLAPFTNPKLIWDFKLSHVKSINVSFHKFGGTMLEWVCVL